MTPDSFILRLAAWLREGARTAVLLRPRWAGLATGPGIMALLLLLNIGVSVLLRRLYIEGPAHFYWQALVGGSWLMLALTAWCAWLARGTASSIFTATAPDASRLLTMLLAQNLVLAVVVGLLY